MTVPRAPLTPSGVTSAAPHVRNGADVRGAMRAVLIALAPCAALALYNTGHQARLAMDALGVTSAPGWRGALLDAVGSDYAAASVWGCIGHGALYFAPLLAATFAAGGAWELAFARARRRPPGDAFPVIALLFALSLPPTLPAWQAALGISFGVVLGKEVFGGDGRNFANPALVGLAFLYFTYPGAVRGDHVWVAVEGWREATPIAIAAAGGVAELERAGVTWVQTWLGLVPGAFGTTSPLACLAGGALLVHLRLASWRIVAGAGAGLLLAALVARAAGGPAPLAGLPWYWHLTLGSVAFGIAFLATDPVTAACTDAGRWLYGALIGALIVGIRAFNPGHPDGVLLALLLGNAAAPLLDHAVVRADVARRRRRLG